MECVTLAQPLVSVSPVTGDLDVLLPVPVELVSLPVVVSVVVFATMELTVMVPVSVSSDSTLHPTVKTVPRTPLVEETVFATTATVCVRTDSGDLHALKSVQVSPMLVSPVMTVECATQPLESAIV